MHLHELIGITDELLALSRAGFPLQRGLQLRRGDMGGRVRQLSRKLAERLEAGWTLSDALRDRETGIPPVFSAMLEVGERSGDITSGLETITEVSQQMLQVRRFVTTAMLYPLVILLLATALAAGILPLLAEQLIATYSDLRFSPNSAGIEALRWMGWIGTYAWTIPLLLVVLLALAMIQLRFARANSWQRLVGPAAYLPWSRRVIRSSQQEILCEATSRLLRRQVPLPDAVSLAANVVGQSQQLVQAESLAQRIRSGDLRSWSPRDYRALPTQLVWALRSGTSREDAAAILSRAARFYGHQRERHELWLRAYFPILCLVLLGGWVAGLFIFSFMVPWTQLLYELGSSDVLGGV